MHSDEVSARIQLVQAHQFDPQLGCALGRDKGIRRYHPHLEAQGPLGHDRADVAQADHAQHLVADFTASEFFTLPASGLERGAGLRNVAGQGQEQGERMLSGGDVVAARGVHHHNALLGGGLDVDVINPNPGPADHPQIGGGGDDRFGHPRAAADDEPVVRRDSTDEVCAGESEPDLHLQVCAGAQLFQSLRGKGVRNQYFL